ncbi:ankyrin repeat-containing domain protein [Mycena sanguinolenta]|nr:ankyrin repeat-containing domain protein [Mycena sanguinolenta]
MSGSVIIKTLKHSAYQNEQAHGHMISALTEATQEHRIDHNAGAGKTVLVSIVVDHLRTELASNSIGVAVIYLNHKEVDAHSPSKLLASLWRQLVFRQPIGPNVHRLYEKHHEPRTRPSLHEDHAILHSIIADYSKVFILVDALDEYPEAQRDVLLHLLSTLGPGFNLLAKYLEGQIVKSSRLSKHIRNSPDLREAIEAKIVQRSDGMFLLAKLHIDSLGTKLTVKAVREALNSLPHELSGTFDEVVHRINGQSEEEKTLAWFVLSWVTNARRPLELSELTVALAVEAGSTKLNTENLPDMEDILSVCAGLVIIREDKRVHVIHYTLQHYLERIQTRVFPHSQSEITTACITYLLFTEFPRHNIGHALAKHLFATNPLLDYAVNYVLIHAHGEPEYDIKDTILSFLDQCSGWVELWNWLHRLERIPTSGTHVWIAAFFDLQEITRCLIPNNGVEANGTVTPIPLPPPPSAVYVAIVQGYTDEARILVGDRPYVEALGEYYGTALQYAVSKEQEETLRLLLEGSDGDLDAKGSPQGGAFQTAVSRGNLAMARIFIEHDINMKWAGMLRSKLLASCDEIIKLLIEYGIDIEACGWRSGALIAASLVGYEATVRLLIESGADVNGTDTQVDAKHESVVASSSSYLPAVPVNSSERTHGSEPAEMDLNTLDVGNLPVLPASGAEGALTMDILEGAMWERFGSCDGFLRIVLCSTSTGPIYSVKFKEGGYATEILKRLSGDTLSGLINGDGIRLSYGRKKLFSVRSRTNVDEDPAWHRLVQGTVADTSDPHSKISGVGPPLETAFKPSGVNREHEIRETGGPYGNALKAASSAGHQAIVRLLIEYGADINFMASPGKNALEAASSGGYEHIVQLLIEHGANVNSTDVLTAASRNGHERTVRLLIEHGVNINSTNALQAASLTGAEQIVRLLLEHGADINSTHALDAASSRGNEQIVRLLIEHGADVTESALEEAAGEGHEHIVRLLIEHGADVNTPNVLKGASGGGHNQIVQLLLEHGADVNCTGALTAASQNGHEQIVQLLLEHGAVYSTPTLKAASSRRDEPILRPLPLRKHAKSSGIVQHSLEHRVVHTAFQGFGSYNDSGIMARRRQKNIHAAPATVTAVTPDTETNLNMSVRDYPICSRCLAPAHREIQEYTLIIIACV